MRQDACSRGLVGFLIVLVGFSCLPSCEDDFQRRIKQSKREGYDFVAEQRSGQPYYLKKTFHPTWDLSRQDNLARIEPVSFRNHDDKPIDEAAFKGKPSLVFFFFSHCSTFCPTIMHNMAKLAASLQPIANFRTFGITVDLQRDEPKRLREYLTLFKRAEGLEWALLRPVDQVTLDKLSHEIFPIVLGESKVTEGDFIHSERVFLVDADGFVRGAYNTTDNDLFDEVAKALANLTKPTAGPVTSSVPGARDSSEKSR